MISDLKDINISSPEGKLLMAALTILTVSPGLLILGEDVNGRKETPYGMISRLNRVREACMPPDEDIPFTIVQKIKELRQSGDALIQKVKMIPSSRETSLSITKFQEGVMWLGQELGRMGQENPYPSSKKPETGDVIEPTADGLKF